MSVVAPVQPVRLRAPQPADQSINVAIAPPCAEPRRFRVLATASISAAQASRLIDGCANPEELGDRHRRIRVEDGLIRSRANHRRTMIAGGDTNCIR
jgi:hypothetical protein